MNSFEETSVLHTQTNGGQEITYRLGHEALAELLRSPMRQRIERIARLPFLSGPVSVFPDVTAKPFGFPAGISLLTEPGLLYPLSAPDMGCGYLVLDSGIEVTPELIPRQTLISAFDAIIDAIGTRSLRRVPFNAVPVADVLKDGLAVAPRPRCFEIDSTAAEEGNSWDASSTLLDASYTKGSLQSALGSAAGHFVACYVVESAVTASAPPPGRIIVVVHAGAAPIRDHLNKQGFYLRLAQAAIDSGLCATEDAADGLFPADIATDVGRLFIGSAMASRNYGYVTRQLVAEAVQERLVEHFQRAQIAPARLLRHVDHVAFESFGSAIRSRRGLQPLYPSRPVFITGGEHTHAYLCDAASKSLEAGDLCCHGVPVSVAPTLSPEAASDRLSVQHVRNWAMDAVSNTEVDEMRFRHDVANLEYVGAYLEESMTASRIALLRPLMNYKELNL